MSNKYLQTKKTSLSYSISASETTMRLDSLLKLDGTNVSASDIGDFMTFTFDPGTSKEEICSINSTNITLNVDGTVDLTNVVRGLKEVDPYTTGGYSCEHGAGAVVVFSNNPQLYNQMANKSNPNTFTQQNIFNGFAPQTNTDPVAGNDLTRLSYVQSLILGTLTTINLILPGTAGETIAAGQLVYLKSSDNRWWLADADTASTVNNVQLGIAQGAGTAGTSILNGIMTQGVDTHQTGLTGGQVQYASNTAGAISSTAGTIEVTVGIAKSATELMIAPRFDQQLTEDQQDALIGTTGLPSLTNKFVTSEDIRLVQTGVYGDGSDGDITNSANNTLTRDMYYNNLTLNSGFTLNTAGYKVFVKGTLTQVGTGMFINNGSNGGNGGLGGTVTGGTAGTAGAGGLEGTLKGGRTGTSGSVGGAGGNNGTNGSNGTSINGATTTASLINGTASSVAGKTGGAGGSGGGNSGGTALTVGTAGSIISIKEKIIGINSIYNDFTSMVSGVLSPIEYQGVNGGSCSGGGGGGGGSSQGGGGGGSGGNGGNGGAIVVSAKNIITASNQLASSTGGNGGNAGNGGAGVNMNAGGGGGGGGGNGGNGGIVIVYYSTLSGSLSATLNGGTGGALGTGGAAGGVSGSVGLSGTAGNSGLSGILISISLS